MPSQAAPVGPLRLGLARVAPTRAEVWTYGVGSLLPFAILALARHLLAREAADEARWIDHWYVQLGELELWAVWGWAWWVGSRLLGRFAPRAWRAAFHLAGAALCLFSALDLAYYQTTGSRSDWEMLAYGFRDFERVWPVVSSELTAGRWAALGAVLAICLAPLARRAREGAAGWRTLVWLAALAPVVHMEIEGRGKPVADLRPLQASVFDTLLVDGMERFGEVVIPAGPEELVPLAVRAREGARHPNVVLVLLESVGARSTTPYTPTLQTTPNLARMASEGLLIEELTAVVPHTSKALVSTLCGDWPYLRADTRESRPGGLPGRCLGELLADAGYRTGFFQPARGDFEDRIGLVHEMGFGTFRPRGLIESPGFEKTNYFGIDDRAMIEPGLEWSTAEPDRPFFATYLTLTSHHDYTVPAHWPTKEWPGLVGRRAKYLAAVNYVDDFLGRLVDAYRDAGLLEDTVFVVLGDHGEGFGEHGRSQHDLVIYEEGLRVPGVIWGPGVLDRTGKIEGSRQQIDVLPTVLGLAGVDVVGGTPRGRDLLAPAEDRVLYHSCWRAHRCLARREGPDKLVDLYRDGPLRRFDLTTDPLERRDAADKAPPDELQALRADARAWRGRVLGRYEALFARWKHDVQTPDKSPAVATWGDRVSLLGCEPEQRSVLPGETVWLDCRWRAEEALDEALRVSVAARAGKAVNEDTWVPGDGELPVWEWSVGHAVSDTVRIAVPWGAKPGPLVVDVGWETYSGSDLTLADGKARREIATVTVLPRPVRSPGPGALVATGDESPVEEPDDDALDAAATR